MKTKWGIRMENENESEGRKVFVNRWGAQAAQAVQVNPEIRETKFFVPVPASMAKCAKQ